MGPLVRLDKRVYQGANGVLATVDTTHDPDSSVASSVEVPRC